MTLANNHVLLVEHDTTAAAQMNDVLIGAGYRVSVATDSEDALALLRASRQGPPAGPQTFQAMVCAVSRDGGIHATLLDRVCSEDHIAQVPVLMIVDPTDDAAVIDGTQLGAVDFLLRPVRPVMLLARLRASLERKRMSDRERDYLRLVELERRRAEMLLYDVLPSEIAARMKHGEQVIADSHEGVTVLFADLVGFTGYADGRPAAEVVKLLDALFSRFDEIITSYGVEKIKTIGDGYMAAAGLPTAREDHAVAAADAALAMREIVSDTRADDGTRFELRIGLASGPVIAGVIGQRRHVYDLWGDTVNLASRMESSAPTGCIQVSSATTRLLESRFQLQSRGVVEIKGKRPQQTSLLVGRKRGRRISKRAAFARTARFEVRQALELAEQAMHDMRLVDPDTGLLTARGFMPMAEAKWRRAAQEEGTVLILVAQVEGDEIEASEAKLIAHLLRGTFRDTDLLVRWRPNTFAMVGLERSPTPPHVLGDRLRERAESLIGGRPPPLRLAVRRLQPHRSENEHRLIAMLDTAIGDHEQE